MVFERSKVPYAIRKLTAKYLRIDFKTAFISASLSNGYKFFKQEVISSAHHWMWPVSTLFTLAEPSIEDKLLDLLGTAHRQRKATACSARFDCMMGIGTD
jgi:hypothetical protein